MDNLRFPNGIQLLPDEESVLVAETTMARIRRLDADSPPLSVSHVTGSRSRNRQFATLQQKLGSVDVHLRNN